MRSGVYNIELNRLLTPGTWNIWISLQIETHIAVDLYSAAPL